MKPQKGTRGTKNLAKAFVVLLLFSGSVAAQSLDDRVKPIVASFKGKVSLFAKNLDTGETYALNADERVRTASTIKIRDCPKPLQTGSRKSNRNLCFVRENPWAKTGQHLRIYRLLARNLDLLSFIKSN